MKEEKTTGRKTPILKKIRLVYKGGIRSRKLCDGGDKKSKTDRIRTSDWQTYEINYRKIRKRQK